MSWQFLAQRILRHRPCHTWTGPPVKNMAHEAPCDWALAEVYGPMPRSMALIGCCLGVRSLPL